MLTLQQLITPVTEDEALATALEILKQMGFQSTSWQSGSAQLILVRLFSRVWSTLTTVIAQIAAGGFTSLATGAYMTLVAKYIYNLDRNPASSTIGKIRLTNSAGAPTHTFAAGDIIIADAVNGATVYHSFTNTEGGTLNPGTYLDIEFKADVPGVGSNIAPNVTLYLWTPSYVGMTPTNPAYGTSNTWITTPGQAEESDQRLAQRCMGRFDKLSYGNTDGAYRGWALDAVPELTRVTVLTSPGDGNVTLVGATDLGGLTPTQEGDIEDYVNGVTDGVGRRPLNDIFTAQSAVTVTSPALTVTAYVFPENAATVPALITSALLDLFGTTPIGGKKLVGAQGYIFYDDMIDVCKVAGQKKVALSVSADIALNPDEIYVPAITVNTILVSPGN